MTTLVTAIQGSGEAVVIPNGPKLSYNDLSDAVSKLQKALAYAGLSAHQAVSIALPNNLEFILSFLAVGNQRCIAGIPSEWNRIS